MYTHIIGNSNKYPQYMFKYIRGFSLELHVFMEKIWKIIIKYPSYSIWFPHKYGFTRYLLIVNHGRD